MLHFLSIRNFALIDELQIEFGPGLNLLTGETGSGKSILVDAVGLLVGDRASQEMIRQGREAAEVEGIFRLSRSDHPVSARLEQEGIEIEQSELIIRRQITREGNNRVFLNGRLVTLGLLSEVGSRLVDLHGQHSQQQLLRRSNHLSFLDRFAHHSELLQQVGECYETLRETQQRRKRLVSSERERLQRLDLLRFQKEEIEKLRLEPALDEELQEERDLLASAEERLQAAEETYQLLYEKTDAVLALLDQAGRRLQRLGSLDPRLATLSSQLDEARYQVESVAFETRDYVADVSFDPRRLEHLEERLSEIERAKRKYGKSVDEILAYLEKITEEIEHLENYSEELEDLEVLEKQHRDAYDRAAQHLSESRREAARRLAKEIQSELADLSMDQSRFEVSFQVKEEPEARGVDRVEFLISANPGEEPRPLTRVASGGELSRIMLSLERVSRAGDEPKTLIFDEVDAGIGGRVATVLGRKLAAVADQHQAFCVTHLPQIAAHADRHFLVDKQIEGKRTVVRVRLLSAEERIEELSRMLAGGEVSETTRRQAREMIRTG